MIQQSAGLQLAVVSSVLKLSVLKLSKVVQSSVCAVGLCYVQDVAVSASRCVQVLLGMAGHPCYIDKQTACPQAQPVLPTSKL
jgi:hypothetical protein